MELPKQTAAKQVNAATQRQHDVYTYICIYVCMCVAHRWGNKILLATLWQQAKTAITTKTQVVTNKYELLRRLCWRNSKHPTYAPNTQKLASWEFHRQSDSRLNVFLDVVVLVFAFLEQRLRQQHEWVEKIEVTTAEPSSRRTSSELMKPPESRSHCSSWTLVLYLGLHYY